MTTATTNAFEIDTPEILKLVSDIDQCEARLDELRGSLPGLEYQAERSRDTEARNNVAECEAEIQRLKGLVGDNKRSLYQKRQERRFEIGTALPRDAKLRKLTIAAVNEAAAALEARGTLFAYHMTIRRSGVSVPGGLPMPLIAEVDGLIRWTKDVIRCGLVNEKDVAAVWLREAVAE